MFSLEYLRHFRIGQYAIFDFAASFIGIYILSPLLSKIFRKLRIKIPKQNWLFLTLPIGILTHVIVGTITPMTRDFIDLQGHYILKIIMIGLLILGLREVKIIRK